MKDRLRERPHVIELHRERFDLTCQSALGALAALDLAAFAPFGP
jgi:hypothetical protein